MSFLILGCGSTILVEDGSTSDDPSTANGAGANPSTGAGASPSNGAGANSSTTSGVGPGDCEAICDGNCDQSCNCETYDSECYECRVPEVAIDVRKVRPTRHAGGGLEEGPLPLLQWGPWGGPLAWGRRPKLQAREPFPRVLRPARG